MLKYRSYLFYSYAWKVRRIPESCENPEVSTFSTPWRLSGRSVPLREPFIVISCFWVISELPLIVHPGFFSNRVNSVPKSNPCALVDRPDVRFQVEYRFFRREDDTHMDLKRMTCQFCLKLLNHVLSIPAHELSYAPVEALKMQDLFHSLYSMEGGWSINISLQKKPLTHAGPG
jgi:hypothetical protein